MAATLLLLPPLTGTIFNCCFLQQLINTCRGLGNIMKRIQLDFIANRN